MELTTSDWTQLISALAVALVLFVVAYLAPPRWAVSTLIVLAPFQIISSRFGTVNMGMIYLVGAAHFFRGRIRSLPFIGLFGFIFLVYLLSMSQTQPQTYFDHAFYLIGIGANVVLFYVVYNHVSRIDDIRLILRLFVVMNVLILLYSAIQLTTGFHRFAFLGVREFSFTEMNETKERLIGPFGAAGTNAEVLVLQILLLGYLALHPKSQSSRYILIGMILADFAFLIMSGSRGSFLTLVGSGVLFLWFFRKELQLGRSIAIAATGTLAFAVMSIIVINFTQFNVLYSRLEATQLREGLPDTREKAFTEAWQHIPETPLLGHGPQLRLIDETTRVIPGHIFLNYPHNLYLFLALTIGVLGLVAYLYLFWSFYTWWRRAQRYPSGDAFKDGLPTLAIVLLIAFLVDQLKIEFLRSQFSDHQQYMFALWATFLAATAARPAKPLNGPAHVPGRMVQS